MTPADTGIMGSVPGNRLGISSGTLSLSRTLGRTLGVALLGVFWIARTNACLTVVSNESTAKVMALESTCMLVVAILLIILSINIFFHLKSADHRPVLKEHL